MKTTDYFLKFLYLFESTILPVHLKENNFIQMAASAGHASSLHDRYNF